MPSIEKKEVSALCVCVCVWRKTANNRDKHSESISTAENSLKLGKVIWDQG